MTFDDRQPSLPGIPPPPPPTRGGLDFGYVLLDAAVGGYVAACQLCGDRLISDSQGRAALWAMRHDKTHVDAGAPLTAAGVPLPPDI
jgi:hypothetical protein